MSAYAVNFVEEVAGIYFRSVFLPFKGMTVPQHMHDHDHATFCGSGSARVYVNDQFHCDVKAGHAIEIKAGKRHLFEALEDDTRLTCVHDIASVEAIKARGI